MRPANSASLAVVCFSHAPALDLQRLAEEVGAALGLPPAACRVTRRGSDALAVLDLEGTRIGLGLRDMAAEEAADAAERACSRPRDAAVTKGRTGTAPEDKAGDEPAAPTTGAAGRAPGGQAPGAGARGRTPGGPLDIAAVLVVSVGGDGITVPQDDCPLHSDRYALCASVIDRAGAAEDIAMMVWLEERSAFGGDLFDTVVTAVTNPALSGSPPARAAARVAAPPPPDPAGAPEAVGPSEGRFAPPPPRERDPEAIAMRNIRSALYCDEARPLAPPAPGWQGALSRLLPARPALRPEGALRPGPSGGAAPASTPQDPPPATARGDDATPAALRRPGAAGPVGARRLSLAHRLTIYTMGATLMVLSLPIGAALMTYFALGRENLRLAARAVAVTGTAVGLAHLPEVQRLLALIG